MENPLRDCLGFRMGSAYRRIDRVFNRGFAGIGLSHGHGYILSCLLVAGEQRVTEVAARTGFEQSTVSRLVKELARRKLVRRRRDPADGRAVLLRPASRAEKLRAEIEGILRRAEESTR